MKPLRASAIALLAAGAAVLAGCSSSDDTGGTPATTTTAGTTSAAAPTTSASAGGSTSASSFSITIQSFAYGDPLTVTPGATITVTNQDDVKHDVDGGANFKSELVGKGESTTFTAPTAEGSYSYTCSIHPRMAGTLIVKSA